ncbi:MAG: RNA methyltransferase [Planctomycetes bacterium]|nr:RNA methyltransferase [Planctomycetota bacterium]
MPDLIDIDRPDDPRIADYANLKDAALREAEFRGDRGRFIAESELVVRTLIASTYQVQSVLIDRSHLHRMADAFAHLPATTPVFTVDATTMTAIAGFQFHRGVLACGVRPAATDWRNVASAARTLVVLEGIANPDNVGAVFRNVACLAGKGGGVLLARSCCDPLYRKAIRVSIGHVLSIPWAFIEPWPAALAELAEQGFTTLAMTPDPRATDIAECSPQSIPKPAILIGAEGPGLTPAAMDTCRVRTRIPMAPGTDSLNLATALAIALQRLVVPR